jgi:hypothetical protein
VQHGQWLPWLAENCVISQRTAQLYMRCARNRKTIEANTQCVADLTLNEAAAVLMLSSDVQKLFTFVKRLEDITDPEEIISLCADEDIATFTTNPFGVKNFLDLEEREQLEWYLWVLYGIREYRASAAQAAYHADHLQTRGWTLTEWYGDAGST